MKKEIFENLESQLNSLIKECAFNIKKSSNEFDSLPLSEIRIKVNNCKELQSKIDRLLQIDLYHFIGMGNFTNIQMSKFMSKIKKISNLKSIVREIAAYGERSFMNLINIPQKYTYEVKNLAEQCGVEIKE